MPRRSVEQLSNHLKNVSYCGNREYSAIHENGNALRFCFFKTKCKSYLCETCRKSNYLKIRNRLNLSFVGKNVAMWTLSTSKSITGTPEGIEWLCKTWDTFLKRIRRIYKDVKYIRILEIGEKGNAHFHVLFNRFLSHSIVMQNWNDLTGGQQVRYDIIDEHRVKKYVTKYLSDAEKSNRTNEETLFLAKVRRISYSQNFLEKVKQLYKLIKFKRCYSWESFDKFMNTFCDVIFSYSENIELFLHKHFQAIETNIPEIKNIILNEIQIPAKINISISEKFPSSNVSLVNNQVGFSF